jgi:hypothetical protein
VLRDPGYTAAYCNQRAHVHAAAGEYELALADYAIVLQLDPLNVTALSGREQALYSQQAHVSESENSTPSEPAQPGHTTIMPNRRRGTMIHQAAESADATIESASAETDEDLDLDASDDFELVPENPPASAKEGAAAPDASSAEAATTAPATEAGPFQKRIANEQQQIEMSERARLWANLRSRERRAGLTMESSSESSPVREAREYGPWVRRVVAAVAASILLLGLGGGSYYWFTHREIKLTADEVGIEFAKSTKDASEKYKGKWVQVSGKVIIQADGKATRIGFDGPKDAKWRIEFSLRPTELGEIKTGQEITVRGRLAPRKNPDSNLMLSNCNLVK